MYVDAHTHLDFFGQRIDEALKEITDNKILTVANSMDLESYRKNKEYAARCPYVIPAFGVHPWKAGACNEELTKLLPLIEESPMIGEIGLDTVWAPEPQNYARQQEVYYFLLEEGRKRNKVITIHTKGAEEEIYESLKGHDCSNIIIHWYSGDMETFEKLISLGCYFTISVDCATSSLTEQLIKRIPMDRLLVETDGPTALEWVNGTYGMPSEIIRMVEHIAIEKQMDVDSLKEIIWRNFCQLMGKSGVLLTIK